MQHLLLNHWPEIILALFAVAAGQMGRLGQKLERGETVGRRQVLIELSMFPAFGGMVGALGAEMVWPIWVLLGTGVTAGWLGFGTFRIIQSVFTQLLQTVLRGAGQTDLGQPPPSPPAPPNP